MRALQEAAWRGRVFSVFGNQVVEKGGSSSIGLTKKEGSLMYQGLEATEKAARIVFSLGQHSQESVSITRKLKRPDKLSPIKKSRLISRLPVVNWKISQLMGRLQVG